MAAITKVDTQQLRRMKGSDGLVLQGCGGDLAEWVDGLNELLTKENILKNGSQFERAYVFEHKGCTNLLFPLEDVELDMGKLAVWRLATREQFGSMWHSDYVDNYLGGPLPDSPEETAVMRKPDCPLIGQDGNIFNLMGIAGRTLRDNGMPEQAKEMRSRIMESGSYHEALAIIQDYANVTSAEDMDEDYEEGMEMDY